MFVIKNTNYHKFNRLCAAIMGKANKSKTANEQVNAAQREEETAIRVDSKTNNIFITLLVKPGAKQNNITGISSEGVGIQINAPPSDGEANAELVKYLAHVLNLRKSDVEIERGFKSRNKVVRIRAECTVAELEKKIKTEIDS